MQIESSAAENAKMVAAALLSGVQKSIRCEKMYE